MPAYFDYNATTPLHPAARQAMLQAEDRYWYNASGLYREAAAAKTALEDARYQLADYLNGEPEEIIFTSGATESNNAVIQWLAQHPQALHHSYSMLEHPSLREPSEKWLAGSSRSRLLPVTASGMADMEALPHAALPAGSVVSLMAANNETGILQPWQEAAAASQKNGWLFHCDAAQWFGKLPQADWSQCDFLTGSGHKFGGPKGIGFLRISSRVRSFAGQRGGPQEARRRAGTENVPAVLGMLAALQACKPPLNPAGRDLFENSLPQLLPGVQIVGQDQPRLPNTSLVILPQGSNTQWLARLSAKGFATSTGSACSSGQGASEVLQGMGYAPELMRRVLRFSSGPETTAGEWQGLGDALRELSGG